MRYRQVGEEVFLNASGESKVIYSMRMAEVYDSAVTQTKELERELDDFAVSIWGPRAELLSYRLREQNIEKMLVFDFNERAITKISIPPRL